MNELVKKIDALNFSKRAYGRRHNKNWGMDCYVFSGTLKSGDFKFTRPFYKGVGLENELNKNEFLRCVVGDAIAYCSCNSLNDFMDEFGYEDEKKARKIFNACKSIYSELTNYFSEDELYNVANYFNELEEKDLL